MKGLKSFFWGGALLALLLTGCRGDIDYMIEEYNSRFGIHDDRLLPGDLNYNQNNMLLDEYHVYYTHDFSIPAPQIKGATYRWELYQDQQEIQTNLDTTHHHFHLYLLENLQVGTYVLYLTMTVDGKVYRDWAYVSVHMQENSI